MTAEENRSTGLFPLDDGRTVFGAMLISGTDSSVTLYDDLEFDWSSKSYSYLAGVLHDGEHVTLLHGVLERMSKHGSDRSKLKCSAKIFPNIIVKGPRHMPQVKPCVTKITFGLHDAASVFYEFDAFSFVLNPEPFVPLLQNDKAHIRNIEIGSSPIIGYFSGKFEIIRVGCALGDVTAHHRVSESMRGPRGWRLDNKIMLSLHFEEPVTVDESFHRMDALVRFFELLLGREQVIHTLEARLEDQDDRELPLRIVRTHAPQHKKCAGEEQLRSPAPSDVLLCTVEDSKPICAVLTKYFALDHERSDARVRLRRNLEKGRFYDVDRIIAAANMFDILPDSAYPNKNRLPENLETARTTARDLFKPFPETIERNGILNALGRMGDLTLKHKVLHRMQIARLQDHFSGLEDVLREAVDCRNHFVHGSKSRINFSEETGLVTFFTRALEFVFGVSDLVDCGWSYEGWAAGHPQTSHPFGEFRLGYRESFAMFRERFANGQTKA